MKSRISFFLFCLFLSTGLFAQQIISKKNNDKAPYTYTGEPINLGSLNKLLASDAEAVPLVRKAKGQLMTGCALAFVGGYLVGGEIGLLLTNNENSRKANVGIAIGGAIIANIGFVIGKSSTRNLSKAVYLYNKNEAGGNGGPADVILDLGVTENGVGLNLRF